MAERKKIIILPKLSDCGGDTSKQWYIYYSYRSPKSGRMIRFKSFQGLSTAQTSDERYRISRKLIEQLTAKLKAGFNPFEDDNEIVYEDQLQYTHIAKKQGRLRKSNRSINYFFTLYLNERSPDIERSTYTTYKSKFRILWLWLNGKYPDQDYRCFDANIAKEFIQYLRITRKCGNNMIRQYVVLFNKFFNWMIDQDKLRENPFGKIIIKRTPKIPAKFFNEILLERLKAVISKNDPQLWLSALFQIYCFIRPKEQRFLKISDIDIPGGSIVIRSSIAKNKKTQAIVIPEPLRRVLIEMKFDKLPPDYYVFTTTGKPGQKAVSKNYLYNHWVSIRKIMNLPMDYKLYSFKHTGAMRASDHVPLKDLQMQMRHSSLDQTDKYLRQMKATNSIALRNNFPEV